MPAFTRPVEAVDPARLERFNEPYAWHPTSRLVRTVPLYIENRAFAKQDLIEWERDARLRRRITTTTGQDFLRSELDLRRLLWRFLQANHGVFGDYLVTEITYQRLAPTNPETGDPRPGGGIAPTTGEQPLPIIDFTPRLLSDLQFGNDKIGEFFKTQPLFELYRKLLPMVIAYLELKLVYELENDEGRVGDMVRQFDESQQSLPNPTQHDQQILTAVRERLSILHPRPDWDTDSFLAATLRDPNITGNGLFLIPKQQIDSPDTYSNGMIVVAVLLVRLRDLQTLQESRVQQLQRLAGMDNAAQSDQIMNATTQGITNFVFPVIQSLIPADPSGEMTGNIQEIADRLDIRAVIQFWVLLVFKTSLRHQGTDRAQTLAKRVFDLTFSPTNFYMPELHSVQVGTQTEPRGGGEDRRATVVGPSGSTSTVPPQVAPVNVLEPTVQPATDNWDEPVVEPRVTGGGWFNPRELRQMTSANRISLDVDNEGLPMDDPQIGPVPTNEEEEQFLRMLNHTMGLWCPGS